MSRLTILFLAPAVLWSQSTSGTAGVAIWTPGQAVLAIDSRTTLTAGDFTRRGPDECKIRTAGRFLIALAGLNDHAQTKFDAWSLAEEAVSGARSVAEAATLIEHRIEPALQNALFNIQSSDLAGFERHFRLAHVAIVVAGMDNGAPALAAREFVPDRYAGVRVARWEPPPDSTSIDVFGEHSAIDRDYPIRKALADVQSLGRPVEIARRMVQLEISYEPQIVGPPISIVQLTKDGAVWIQPGLCGGIR